MTFDVEKYVVNEHASLRSALLKVDNNHCGMIFMQAVDGKIIGLATDGDLRRALLQGASLEDCISDSANREFVSASIDTPREQLIKQLDGHIRFIPILDQLGKLRSIISKDHLPLDEEKPIYIRARAPVRISFGGGGSDLTHFFEKRSGAVINAAISIYSHATLKVRSDSKIIISSLDLDAKLIANDLEDALSQEGRFGLIQSIIHVVRPTYGFELFLNSDFPVGSGLGGSATVSAVVLGCFNMLREDRWNQHELAEIAFQSERLHLGIAGGWQDQYAAVFGGFNFIEFHVDENVVNPMRLNPEIALELEESLLLCNTGIDHHSGNIHDNQKETMTSELVQGLVNDNVELSYAIRNHLLRGDLEKFGECLDKAWKLKRNFSKMISNDYIDSIYDEAIQNGALGGKLLGAGGGGFFIFYVSPFKKHKLITHLESKNLTVQPFCFEPQGLVTWRARDNTNQVTEAE